LALAGSKKESRREALRLLKEEKMKRRVQSNISRRILLDGTPTIRQRLPFGLIPSGRRQRPGMINQARPPKKEGKGHPWTHLQPFHQQNRSHA
jgi:hypothetical protein